jgi:Spy/CpxP family protein refolding chaperone
MSYVNALFRASQKANSRERKQARDAKRALFEVELIEHVDFDENEVFALREMLTREAIAH